MDLTTQQQVFEEGVRAHQAGRLGEAERAYRKVLGVNPKHADATHLLGVLAHQIGRPADALELIGRAIALNPSAAPFYGNLGLVLAQAGRVDEALAAYGRAVAIKPDFAEGHFQLGNLLAGQGEKARVGEAIRSFRQATILRSTDPLYWYNFAHALGRAGETEQAIDAYRKAIELKPDYSDACVNLGAIFQGVGRYGEAEAVYRQALGVAADSAGVWCSLGSVLLELKRDREAEDNFRRAVLLRPEFPEALFNLGAVLDRRGRREEAREMYRRAIQSRPDFIAAYNSLGSSFFESGQFAEAEAAFRGALNLNPDFEAALYNLGIALDRTGRPDEARAMYRRVIDLNPSFVRAFYSLGSSFYLSGELPQAEAAFARALELRPGDPEARLNLGLIRLVQGDFARGWTDARWEDSDRSRPRDFSQPLWDGSPLDGKCILLHIEQGLGDLVQFVRYVPMVSARGGRVILQGWAAAKRLLQGQLGIEQVVHENESPPAFDVHFPLMSLPRLFGTSLETVPAEVPYLHPKAVLVEQWRQTLAAEPPGLKVGLVWAGNPEHPRDYLRSIPLGDYSSTASVPHVRFYSLQKGHGSSQAQTPPAGMSLTDWTERLRDLAETAAFIKNLDLVITVDTAVAHLAGAIGTPVWVLIQFMPDWRWMLDREDSPWYPTMRLFRQRAPSDWSAPLKSVEAELRRLAETAGAGRA